MLRNVHPESFSWNSEDFRRSGSCTLSMNHCVKSVVCGIGLFAVLNVFNSKTSKTNAKRCCHFYCACAVAKMRCCQIYCACAVLVNYWCRAVARLNTLLSNLLYYCQFYCACAVVRYFWCSAVAIFTTRLSDVLHCCQFYYACAVVGNFGMARFSDWPHYCPIYCTVVNYISQYFDYPAVFEMMRSCRIYCARTFEFATNFQDKNRLAPALCVLTGCKQGIVEIETIRWIIVSYTLRNVKCKKNEMCEM